MWRRPAAADLRGTGLQPKHYKEPMVDVWPECWPAVELYMKYRTQWIQGPGGPCGLNYAILLADLNRAGIEGEEREDIMADIRTIEAEVLAVVYG